MMFSSYFESILERRYARSYLCKTIFSILTPLMLMTLRTFPHRVLLFLFFLTAFSLSAQDSLPPDTVPPFTDEADVTHPEDFDPYILNTPRGAVSRHLFFLQPATYAPEKSIEAFASGNYTKEERIELAIQLKQIYDGLGVYIDAGEIPDELDYLDSASHKARYYPLPGYSDIYVQRYDSVWRYSARTLNRIPEIHRSVYPLGANILVNLIPGVGNREFLGLQVWQWLGLVLMVALTLGFHFLLKHVFGLVLRQLVPLISRSAFLETSLIRRVASPLSYLLIMFLLAAVFPSLQLPVVLNKMFLTFLKLMGGMFAVAVVYRFIDILAAMGSALASKTETTMDDQLVPLVSKTLKVVVVIFGGILVLQNLDVNITALVAGVSIGGLALALAAQDTAKNFLGSISIFLDKPFSVGDFIVTSTLTGSVEEVGVRSTRIRALDGAMVSIPNGVLVNETITNHGNRTYRRYQTEITVTYSTTLAQMEKLVEGIRNILAAHPMVRPVDGYQVFFHDMGASSLKIWMAVIFMTPDYGDWLKARQEVFMAIKSLAESLAVEFAFPSTSVYIESVPKTEKPADLNLGETSILMPPTDEK